MSFIFPEKEVFFVSGHSMSDSVSLLSAKVKSETWLRQLQIEESVVGTVSADEVILYHYRTWPLRWNALQPLFRGSFSKKNGSVVLSGRFKVNRASRIFMTFWLIGTTLLFLFPFVYIKNESSVSFLAIPMVLLSIWFANAFISYRFGHRDIEYISSIIKKALCQSI